MEGQEVNCVEEAKGEGSVIEESANVNVRILIQGDEQELKRQDTVEAKSNPDCNLQPNDVEKRQAWSIAKVSLVRPIKCFSLYTTLVYT